MVEINYLDLFSGIGGFRLGLERVGFKFKNEFHSETDHYANLIYHRHFKNSVLLGDIKNVKGKELPKIDLITGGFPCQDISIANSKGVGIAGARSGLIFEVFRIIGETRPKFVLLENVRNLLSKNHGWDFARILVEMDELGYDVQWELLDSQNFGLAQRRKRVFILGTPKGCACQVFPLGRGGERDDPAVPGSQRQVARKCIHTADGHKGTRHGGENIIASTLGTSPNPQPGYGTHFVASVIQSKGNRRRNFHEQTICARTIETGRQELRTGQADNLILKTLESEKRGWNSDSNVIAGTIAAQTGTGRAWEKKTMSPERYERPSADLPRYGKEIILRVLMPVEKEDLQGFPTDWTLAGEQLLVMPFPSR